MPERAWWAVRWALLAVLLLSFATVLLRTIPADGSTAALVKDIRAGRTSTVRMDAEGTEVTVRWSTGPLAERSYLYRPTRFVAGTAQSANDFTATVRREAGSSADRIRFTDFDATYGAGDMGLLLPALYVLLTPWTWLRVLTLLAGVAVVVRMLTARRHRLADGPAWALAGLVTGVGLIAYLWAEPGAATRSGASAPSGTSPSAGEPIALSMELHWWRAWLASLATTVGLAVLGILVLLAGGRLSA